MRPVFRPLTENGAPPIYTQSSLLGLDFGASRRLWPFRASLVSAVGGNLARHLRDATRTGPSSCRLSRTIVNIGQVFPPVAVLAIAVPLVGFGSTPTLIALVLYGLLPIFENDHHGPKRGSDRNSDARRRAAWDCQRTATLFLAGGTAACLSGDFGRAAPVDRHQSSGTATIGSTVAAKGLGEVIIAGLQSSNTAFILQGGLVVALLAVLVYDAFGLIERALVPTPA